MREDEIVKELKEYILKSSSGAEAFGPLPLDESLFELGILDSFGIVELVVFIENRWYCSK